MKTMWDVAEIVTGNRNGAPFLCNLWKWPDWKGTKWDNNQSMSDKNAARLIPFAKEKYAELKENRRRNRLGTEAQWQYREATWTLNQWQDRLETYEGQQAGMARMGLHSGTLSKRIKRCCANIERIEAGIVYAGTGAEVADNVTWDDKKGWVVRPLGTDVEKTEIVVGPSKHNWRPEWSKKPNATYRELQNIPSGWGVSKVVLIWRGTGRGSLRIFGSWDNARRTLNGLLFEVSVELGNRSGDQEKWDFPLSDAEYYQAANGEVR